MRPEINFELSRWAATVPPIATFDDIWMDGVSDGTAMNGVIFHAGTGFQIGIVDAGLTFGVGTAAILPYNTDLYDVQLTRTFGLQCNGYIDHIRINYPPFTVSTFGVTKRASGPLRRVRPRILVNFPGTHDNFFYNPDPNNVKYYVSYFEILGNSTYQPGYDTELWCRIWRRPGAETLQYGIQVFSDIARTIKLYESDVWMSYGTKYDMTPMVDPSIPIPRPILAYISSYVATDPGADYDFGLVKNVWTINSQNPHSWHWPDISSSLKGQFRITSSESEAILAKDVSRKVNLTLDNTDNVFDYRKFQSVYSPAANPAQYNGPYETIIYDQTGGVQGGKKLGNIRAGRFVVVQVGVWNETWSQWIYVDKFRGRLTDLQYSRADNTVQLTIDDERTWFAQEKTKNDYYINRTVEQIIRSQCVNRLHYDTSRVIMSGTNFNIPFLFMPDMGDTVWTALTKIAESIGGKLDINETGQMVCTARMINGDQAYVFGTGNGEDEPRTLSDMTVDNCNDILSSSTLYNQKIINRVNIQSKPYIVQDTSSKLWKFKAFYDQEKGRNTGWLKPNRYFGDVWAQNTQSANGTGPVKSIDRSNLFDTSVTGIKNESFVLSVTGPPGMGMVNISITRTSDGTVGTGTVPCDGILEFHCGAIHAALANVYVIMESMINITTGDQSELQIGIIYYADFGSEFRALPNYIGVPAADPLRFAIVSSISNPGGATDWTSELISNSTSNNYADRVVMALDPNISGATNYDTENIFYANSKTGSAFTKVPILVVNRDPVNNRYVNSLEIFGRRVVESTNMVVNVKATDTVIKAFGGEQVLEVNNSCIPNTSQAGLLGKWIVDNYSACRDIPQIVLKQPRPFLQVGDRIRNIDSYAGITREYIITSTDEVYSIEDVSMTIKCREADTGTGAYNPLLSQSIVEYQNQTDYTKLQETVDVQKGSAATEVRRDIYFMRGISYHGRRFNFQTGTYSNTPPGPPPAIAAPPAGIVESYFGEPRLFDTPPTVIVTPLHVARTAGGGPDNTPGQAAYAIPGSLTTDHFDGICYVDGNTIVYGWFHWIAIGVTKTTT